MHWYHSFIHSFFFFFKTRFLCVALCTSAFAGIKDTSTTTTQPSFTCQTPLQKSHTQQQWNILMELISNTCHLRTGAQLTRGCLTAVWERPFAPRPTWLGLLFVKLLLGSFSQTKPRHLAMPSSSYPFQNTGSTFTLSSLLSSSCIFSLEILPSGEKSQSI